MQANGGLWWKADVAPEHPTGQEAIMFAIEDDLHGEPGAAFATKGEAQAEMRRLAALP